MQSSLFNIVSFSPFPNLVNFDIRSKFESLDLLIHGDNNPIVFSNFQFLPLAVYFYLRHYSFLFTNHYNTNHCYSIINMLGLSGLFALVQGMFLASKLVSAFWKPRSKKKERKNDSQKILYWFCCWLKNSIFLFGEKKGVSTTLAQFFFQLFKLKCFLRTISKRNQIIWRV